MKPLGWISKLKKLDLQAKISLVLVAVIVPTFAVVTVIENEMTSPVLREEMKQIGISSGKTLAGQIVARKLLQTEASQDAIESLLQEWLLVQPSITRIDVLAKNPRTGTNQVVASNYEVDPEDADVTTPGFEVDERVQAQLTRQFRSEISAELLENEEDLESWEIVVPIERAGPTLGRASVLGAVRLVVSLRTVGSLLGALWKVTATAAFLTVLTLLFVLNYFLRRTIADDRRLREAEDQNEQLSAQLHEAERQLRVTEKLAVMGQLTASFAHEIGTPLSAVGGHVQLLREEVSRVANTEGLDGERVRERFEIIEAQLQKIATIVRNFLQSTAKPTSQRQLVDPNPLVRQTLRIVRPRIEALGVGVRTRLSESLAPLRVVPLEVEQILLNLVQNSLDSLAEKKRQAGDRFQGRLEIESSTRKQAGREWAEIRVFDSGLGIAGADLTQVLKPFYTTKAPGEGTGLGLTICEQLARKYGGVLKLESKEGAWTRATLRLPYS